VGRASADEVELRPNHAHWRGAPALASVTVRCGLRGAAQLAAACAGAVDAGDALPEAVEAADELLWARPDMVIAAAPVLAAGGSWAFDLADPRFADQRVRRALSLALDRATIRARAHGGHARHVPVQAWPFVLDAPPTPADLGPWHRHDLATARELLAAAGQPALRFTVAASDDAPPAVRRERVLMAEQLRAAGVGARLEAQPARAFAARWAAADFAGVADGPATAPPAARAWYHDQVVTRRAGPGANHWRIADPELDRWAEAQRVELDPYARRELLRRSWDHLQDRVYRIERAQPFPLAARPAWLRGWRALTPFAATDVAAAWGGGSVATWRDERLERS
jgi:ABC-type transport system substrate-binding protein